MKRRNWFSALLFALLNFGMHVVFSQESQNNTDPPCAVDDGQSPKYGEKYGAFFGTVANSNGGCTGDSFGRGEWQCVDFVERDYGHKEWRCGSAYKMYGLYNDYGLAQSVDGQRVPPLPGNIIVYGPTSTNKDGHVAIITAVDLVNNQVTVMDQNRSRSNPTRTHTVTVTGVGENRMYSIPNTGGADVYGWLGVKVGSRQQDLTPTGTQNQAFVNGYNRYGTKLGWSFENGGGPWVHVWNGVTLQDLLQPDPERDPFGSDGQTALILNSTGTDAHLVKEGNWCWYKRNNGPINLGAPKGEEYPFGNGTKQEFVNGYLIWNGEQGDCSSVITAYRTDGSVIPTQTVTINSTPGGATISNEGIVQIAGFQEPMKKGYTYNMKAELSGYETTHFQFTPNADTTVSVTLPVDDNTGYINLISDPSGAQACLNGNSWPSLGELTPLMNKPLPVGTHVFSIQKSGYGTSTVSCPIEDGKTAEWQVRLNPPSFPLTYEAENMQGTGIVVSGGMKLTGPDQPNHWYCFTNINFPEGGVLETEVVVKADDPQGNPWPKILMKYNGNNTASQEIVATDYASYFFQGYVTGTGQWGIDINLDGSTRESYHAVTIDKMIIRYIPAPPPASPSNLVVLATGLNSTLIWTDNATDEQGYIVEYKTPNSSSFTHLTSLPSNTTSWQFQLPGMHEVYTFRVKAYIAGGGIKSGACHESFAKTIEKPQADSVKTLSPTKAKLYWTDRSNLEDHFKLQRKVLSGSFTDIAEVGANVTSFIDSTGLTGGNTYVYRLCGVANNTSLSENSDTLSVYVGDPSPTGTLTFNPSHDSYVKSSSPTSNYGRSSTLQVYRSSSSDRDAYLKFVVTGTNGYAPSVAKLRVRCTSSSDDGGSVYLVANNFLGTQNPWVEGSLNWNNAPGIQGTAFGPLGEVSSGDWYEVIVTSAISGDGMYSFAISNQSSDVAYYSSKDGDYAPELVLEFTGGVQQNNPPAAVNDVASTTMNTAVVVNVPANDMDSDGTLDLSTVTVTSAFLHGSSSVNATTGAITYTPTTGYAGLDSCFYTIKDNLGATSNAAKVRITVTSGGGSTTLTFTPTHDAYVYSASSFNYGTQSYMYIENGAFGVRNSYPKFVVTGIGSGTVTNAKLRLYCIDSSPNGGTVYTTSNNYQGNSTPWVETGIVYTNAPASSGSALASAGSVSSSSWIELTVTPAIVGDGIYSFLVTNGGSDAARYEAKETPVFRPELVVDVALAKHANWEEDELVTIPNRYDLFQSYPNPFNPETSIKFALLEEQIVHLAIYNIVGQKMRTLIDGLLFEPGYHTAAWDGRDDFGKPVTSGVYLYLIEAGGFRQAKKMLMLK